jgi:hypothetical protein
MGRLYADGTEAMEITIGLPPPGIEAREGCRVPFTIQIGNEQYLAGMRSTADAGIWLCPDLRDKFGRRVTLAKALLSNGFSKNQVVRFDGTADVIALLPG